YALRIKVADAAALAACRRVDHSVDERRPAGVHGSIDGALQLIGRRYIGADASERLNHLVVARAFDEDSRRRVRTASGIDVRSPINAVVVEDDDADRQVVPADRFHLHTGEAKGAVAFDREHGFAGLDCCCDGKAHSDAHDTPGADVKPFAWLVHVDNPASEIERVGAFVDEDGIRSLFDNGSQRTERAVEVHRCRVLYQPRSHLGDVLFPFPFDGVGPVGWWSRPLAVDAVKERRYAGRDIADQRSNDRNVAVHLLGLDVDLDEFL